MGEATSFSPPPGLSTTFTELVSAGRLGLIESQSLRRSLVAYDEYASLNRDQISIFERPITESKPVIFRAITLEATGVAKTEFDDLEALLDVDRDLLRTDPEILTALQVVYATQDNIHVVLISIRGTILDLLDQIKAERAARLISFALNAHHLALSRASSMLVHRGLAGFYELIDTVFCRCQIEVRRGHFGLCFQVLQSTC